MPFFQQGSKQLFTASRILWAATIGVFGTLAGRIAASSTFPLPFDESYHFGLINVYARHLNPFLTAQPPGANAYGAVARDPSYLYHYVLSFPVRLFDLVGMSQMSQVYALRFINVGLGVVTLYLTYRLVLRGGLPKWLGQLVVLGLAVTPAFYELSGQINYDNLMIPLTLVTLLLALSTADLFREGKIPSKQLIGLISVMLLNSLVKYSYLPILVSLIVYLIFAALRGIGTRRLIIVVRDNLAELSFTAVALAIAFMIVSTGLWGQRYLVNLAEYKTPHPQCNAVLSVTQCQDYGPWARNYKLAATSASRPLVDHVALPFTMYWLRAMYLQLFSNVQVVGSKVVYTPLTVQRVVARAALLSGVPLALISLIVSRRHRENWFVLLGVTMCYVAALWMQNFSDYRHLHEMVAIQGRYLLPVLPVIYGLSALGFYRVSKLVLLKQNTTR